MTAFDRPRLVHVEPRPEAVAKFNMLQSLAHRDAIDPVVVAFASKLAAPHAPDDWHGIAREIFAFVRDGIRYQHDPDRREELAPARLVLARGWDDCDGKARLAVALMRAVGLDAQIVPLWRRGQLAHVSIRVRFPGSERAAGNVAGWLPGELTIRGAELGDNPRRIAPNPQTGKLPLSGGPDSGAIPPCCG